MKTPSVLAILPLALLLFASPGLTADSGPEALIEHLERTRNDVSEAVSDLSVEQWSWKPAPDRWSVAECVEHIVLAEAAIRSQITDSVLTSDATPKPFLPQQGKDDWVLRTVTDRSFRVQTNQALTPSASFATPAEAIAGFEKTRKETLGLAESRSSDLRTHVGFHGAFGHLDAHQWLLFLSGHTERHRLQILEVMESPGFPKR